MVLVEVEIEGEKQTFDVDEQGRFLVEAGHPMPWRRKRAMVEGPHSCRFFCSEEQRVMHERQQHILEERLLATECLFFVYPTCQVAKCLAPATGGFALGRAGRLYGKWLDVDDSMELCLGHAVDGEGAELPNIPGQAGSVAAESFACSRAVVRCESHTIPRLRCHFVSRRLIAISGIAEHLRPVDLRFEVAETARHAAALGGDGGGS